MLHVGVERSAGFKYWMFDIFTSLFGDDSQAMLEQEFLIFFNRGETTTLDLDLFGEKKRTLSLLPATE